MAWVMFMTALVLVLWYAFNGREVMIFFARAFAIAAVIAAMACVWAVIFS